MSFNVYDSKFVTVSVDLSLSLNVAVDAIYHERHSESHQSLLYQAINCEILLGWLVD